MKKIICIFAILLLLFSTGCGSSYINDSETGEVTAEANRYKYNDGVYTVYFDYFNQEGYCYVMRATITDGIIASVSFDKFNTDYKRFTQITDEELADEIHQFKNEVKALNTIIFQKQHYTALTPGEAGSVSSQYYSLMVNIVKLALQENSEKIYGVHATRRYSVKSEPDLQGIISHLSVSYSGDNVSDISFYQTNQEGLKMEGFLSNDDSLSYDDQIKKLTSFTPETTSPYKEEAESISSELLYVYNQLCLDIEEMRISFDITKVTSPR